MSRMELSAQMSQEIRARFYPQGTHRTCSPEPFASESSVVLPAHVERCLSAGGSRAAIGRRTPEPLSQSALTAAPQPSEPEPHVFRIALFSAKTYDVDAFEEERERLNAAMAGSAHSLPVRFQIEYIEEPLDAVTVAELLPPGCDAVCGFVNDGCTAPALEYLRSQGVQLLLNRCAGFNNVDMHAADRHGMRVMRVPMYSPQSVAEHAIALLMAVNRKTHVAHARCQEKNFDLVRLLLQWIFHDLF